MEPVIINIPPIKLEHQDPDKEGSIVLELHDKYVVYKANFYAEEPKDKDDKSLGIETVYNNFELAAFKHQCVCVEKSWLSQAKRWSVYIYVNGLGYDIKMYFKKESEATEVYNKVFKWLYD